MLFVSWMYLSPSLCSLLYSGYRDVVIRICVDIVNGLFLDDQTVQVFQSTMDGAQWKASRAEIGTTKSFFTALFESKIEVLLPLNLHSAEENDLFVDFIGSDSNPRDEPIRDRVRVGQVGNLDEPDEDDIWADGEDTHHTQILPFVSFCREFDSRIPLFDLFEHVNCSLKSPSDTVPVNSFSPFSHFGGDRCNLEFHCEFEVRITFHSHLIIILLFSSKVFSQMTALVKEI